MPNNTSSTPLSSYTGEKKKWGGGKNENTHTHTKTEGTKGRKKTIMKTGEKKERGIKKKRKERKKERKREKEKKEREKDFTGDAKRAIELLIKAPRVIKQVSHTEYPGRARRHRTD